MLRLRTELVQGRSPNDAAVRIVARCSNLDYAAVLIVAGDRVISRRLVDMDYMTRLLRKRRTRKHRNDGKSGQHQFHV